MSTLFEKGSRWRKWDLHVHTPESIIHNFHKDSYSNIWEKYLNDLETLDSNIKVLGINDYLFIDGYKKILSEKEKGRLQNIDLILPVIELRLKQFNGKDFQKINYHVIFSDEVSVDTIQSQFINSITAKFVLTPDSPRSVTWSGTLTKASLGDLGQAIINSVPEEQKKNYRSPLIEGFNNIAISIEDVEEILQKPYFKDKYITAIGKTEWADWHWSDSSIAEKKTVINKANIIFTASESIEMFQKSQQKLTQEEVNNRLLDCSDAHHNLDSSDKDRLGNCNTWIKADPTFEGLKQVIFEYEDRVKIQQTNPIDSKIKLAVIDKIVLTDENVYNTEIQLNPYLNCIIGGRSTGKSMLLGAIANKMGKIQETPHNQLQQLTDNLTLEWLDGVEDNNRDIEYISQGEMHKLHTDMEQDGDPKLKQIVHKILLNTSDKQNLYNEFEEFSKKSGKSIINMHVDLLSFYDELNSIKQKITELGDESSITQSIKELTDTINSMDIITDQEQKILDVFNEKLREIEEQTGDILHKKKSLSTIKTHITNIFESEINFEGFTDLQNIFDESKSQLLNKIDEQISQERNVLNEKNDELGIRHTEITEDTNYKQLIEKTRKSNEYAELRKKIQEQAHMLVGLNKALEKRKEVEKKFNEARESFVKEHKQYHKKLTELCNLLQLDSEDLKISTTPKLLASKIHQVFSDNLKDRRSSEEQKLIKIDNVKSIEEFITYISNILKGIFDDKVFASYRSGKTYKDLLQSLSQFFYEIDYSIFYENDDEFRNMSEGKKSFVVLKLILEFSNKTCPLLIDQPEDDLDNRSIYTDLVKYIKSKKIDRQIILVTHNPNIVVGADAEEVIIANQHGTKTKNESDKKFQYITGSLEHTSTKDTRQDIILKSQGVREHVCDILEGGQSAFEKREHKYNFHN